MTSGTIAQWTIVDPGLPPSHWASVITCPHGTTTNGVWLDPRIDDRNLLPLAGSTFANHQSLWPECDCTLEQDWQPSYQPPPPPPSQLAVKAAPAAVTPRDASGIATYTMTPMLPTWYAMTIDCPHGETQEGIWLYEASPPMTSPDTPPAAYSALNNHVNVTGCSCVFQTPSTQGTANVNFLPVSSVADGSTVFIPIDTSTLVATAPFAVDGYSRLTVTVTGTLTLTASFFLAQSIAQGGGGIAALRLPSSADPTLTDPSIATTGFTDGPTATATATFVWSGLVTATSTAGVAIELNYYNGTGVYQDIQGGSIQAIFVPA